MAKFVAGVLVLVMSSGVFVNVLGQSSANAVPFIEQPLVPVSVAPAGPAFTLTVNGLGFVSTSTVNWNGSPRTTTFVSSMQVTAAISAADIASAGTASVTVVNPTPGGGTSNVQFFGVSSPATSLAFGELNVNTGPYDEAQFMITADFRGDGKLDLAFVTPSESSPASSYALVEVLGNGDGTFQPAAPVNPEPYPVGPGDVTAVTAADFNGDGKLDLAVLAADDSTFLGNGDGTFQPATLFPNCFELDNLNNEILAADLNHDGKVDLVVPGLGVFPDPESICVVLGNGDGTFQTAVSYPVNGTQGGEPAALTLGDFKNNGIFDIVAVDEGGQIWEFLGNGDGTFQSPVSVSPQFSSAYQYVAGIIAADLNGDGKLDLAMSWDITNSTGVALSAGVSVLLGNGDGTFAAAVNYPTPFNADYLFGAAADIAAGDLNADGKLDLVVSAFDSSQGSIAVLLGDGDGTFQAALSFPAGPVTAMGEPVIADFNGDGKLDVAVGQWKLGSSGLALGSGIGVFLQGQGFPIASTDPLSLTFAPQASGTTSPAQTVTLSNTGTATLNIANIAVTGTNASNFFQTNTCSATLNAGANCQITVTFTSTGTGPWLAGVTITDNAPGGAQTIGLAGTIPPPVATLSPTQLVFPSQYVGTTSPPQSVTLTNTGVSPLTITGVFTDPDISVVSACGSSLPSGSSCSISVSLDPTVGGIIGDGLTVTDNTVIGYQSISLIGTGLDFSIAPSGSATASITPGQSASYQIAVAPLGGFNQTVALSCTGAPSGSTCTVSQSPVPLDGSTTTTVSVVVAAAGQSMLTYWPRNRPGSVPVIFFVFAFSAIALSLSFAVSTAARRRWVPTLALSLFISMGTLLTGCGGGSSGGGSTGPPAGTYTLNVTGTFSSGSTTLTHSTALTLVVQ